MNIDFINGMSKSYWIASRNETNYPSLKMT